MISTHTTICLPTTTVPRSMRARIIGVALIGVFGCSGETQVELTAFGEAFVEEGIEAEAFVDGWSVSFSELVVSVNDVRTSPGGPVSSGGFVVDLSLPSGGDGHPLTRTAVEGDVLQSVHYRLSPPSGEVEGNATAAQVDRLRAEGLAVWAQGTATRDGQIVEFAWGIPADLSFDCDVGTRLSPGTPAGVELTMHGDHLFVDDLEVAPNVAFDEIARADSDGDGLVVPSELAAVPLAGLARYQTGGRTDIDDLWAYVGAAALTMPHVDGEGNCTPRFVPDAYATFETADADPVLGAEVYAEHCASCHGAEGSGDGPGGAGMSPRPSDLTNPPPGARAAGYIAFRTARGGAMFPYASAMPAYEDVLDEAELSSVVAYVRELSGG